MRALELIKSEEAVGSVGHDRQFTCCFCKGDAPAGHIFSNGRGTTICAACVAQATSLINKGLQYGAH